MTRNPNGQFSGGPVGEESPVKPDEAEEIEKPEQKPEKLSEKIEILSELD